MPDVRLPSLVFAWTVGAIVSALAQGGAPPGLTPTEILIGQTMPYSGPASSFSAIGKGMAAWFEKVNRDGGVNGRKIKLVSLDDAYNPAKAVEQTRRLVERDNVFAIVGTFGSPSNFAIQKYLNGKSIPSLFLVTGANRVSDPQQYPWSMGWQPNNVAKGRIYAKFVARTRPNAKVAILFQNDDFGRDIVKGFRDGLGDKASSVIVKELSYEISEPTVEQQIQILRATGADVFLDISTPKFAAQAIRRVAEMKWDVLHLLSDAAGSVASVLTPAGLDNSKNVITMNFRKEFTDPALAEDEGVKNYFAFMREYMPGADATESYYTFGISTAQTFVHVLAMCGNDVTRENIMKQAANLKRVSLPLLLPGVTLDTSPTRFTPLHQEQILQFDGVRWVAVGGVIDALD